MWSAAIHVASGTEGTEDSALWGAQWTRDPSDKIEAIRTTLDMASMSGQLTNNMGLGRLMLRVKRWVKR